MKRDMETKHAEDKNKPAWSRHSQLLNALPHALIVVGGDLQIYYANADAENLFSLSAAGLTRHCLPDLFSFDSPVVSLVQLVQRQKSSVNEYNVELSSPRFHEARVMDLHVSCLTEDQDQTIIMLQHREIAQKIEKQLAYRGAARSVSGMAAMLSHEIRNPLSGIKGAAQLIEQNITKEDRALTTLIITETDRISNLVQGLEVFGYDRPRNSDLINIHAVLNHVKQLSISGFARNVEFVEVYDPSLPEVSGHHDSLVQVFLNLIKNAVEAVAENGPGGKIWLTSSYSPGVSLAVAGTSRRVSLPLQITVEDNGPGISEEIKQNLFDPFVTTKNSGSGLGLALVAKVIRDHGGLVACEEQKQRTVFKVLLPHEQPQKS